MNLRRYKKRAKLAKSALIAEHGFKESDFQKIERRDRDEYAICVSEPMDAHLWDFQNSIYPLRGTPFFLPEPVDYWGEANDPLCCIELLEHTIFWDTCGDSIGRKISRGELA